jgi:hypothetical protein
MDKLKFKPGTKGSETVYRIKDENDVVRGEHVRIDKTDGTKDVFWRGGLKGASLADMPLYGAHLLKDWERDVPIVVVEGEKAAESLWDRGVPALGTVTGASATPSVQALMPLRGRPVVLWPDNDEVGEHHMRRLAWNLASLTNDVQWVRSPNGTPKGWDAADYDAQEVNGLLAKAELMDSGEMLSPDEPPPGSLVIEQPLPVLADIISTWDESEERWVCENIWKPGSLTLVVGKQQSFKSWLAVELMRCSLSGDDFLGHEMKMKYDAVVYMTGEKSPRAVLERMYDAYRDQMDLAEHIHVVTRKERARIGESGWEELVQKVHAVPGDGRVMVILDTLASLAPGGYDENSFMHVSKVLDALKFMASDPRVDMFLIHHTGALGMRPRGHTALDGDVDGFIRMERLGDDTMDVLITTEPKDGSQTTAPWRFDINAYQFTQKGAVAGASPYVWTQLVKEYHERNHDWPTRTDIRRAYGFSPNSTTGAKRAIRLGLLREEKMEGAVDIGRKMRLVFISDEERREQRELDQAAERVRIEEESREAYQQERFDHLAKEARKVFAGMEEIDIVTKEPEKTDGPIEGVT